MRPVSSRAARVACAVALVAAIAAPGVTAQSEESGQAVIDWNLNALGALATAAVPPPLAALTMAMVHGAMYDAVNSIVGGYQPYLRPIEAVDGASPSAAAAAAAHDVLLNLYPDQAADLQAKLDTSLEAVPDGAAQDDGVAVGQAAAAAMLAAREGDGRGVPNPLTYGTEPGQYRPTPPEEAEFPLSWIAKVRPFIAESPDAYRTDGPDALTSAEYAADFEEVKTTGGKDSTRTDEQEAMAAFWFSPIGQLSGVERTLATERQLGIADTARLLAIANLAAGDAVIGCFDDKYYWMFWRPVTAIAEAEADGNDATTADPAWLPLLDTPPYPDHPSGFNCLAGAHVGAMRDFFGTDDITFTVNSPDKDPRTFDSLTAVMDEIITVRVLQGLHFRTADVQAAALGHEAAAAAAERLGPA